MHSLKHINAYLYLHGKNVSKDAVDTFLDILHSDINSGRITRAKDKFHKEVDRIQRSLVGMSNAMWEGEVAKVEIEPARKKHYENIVKIQGLGSLPIMIAGAITSLTTHHINKLFTKKKSLAGVAAEKKISKRKSVKKAPKRNPAKKSLGVTDESISGVKKDSKDLRKKLAKKGERLTHGYKIAKRKKVTKKIAKRKSVSKKSNQKELRKGIKVEQEHKGTLKKLAKGKINVKQAIKETAKTHIKEDKKYYDKLAKMENKKPVKASVSAAITDLLTLDKYKKYGAMFLGMFYSTFKNNDSIEKIDGKLKYSLFKKYEYDLFEGDEKWSSYKGDWFENVVLTDKGKELIKSIEGRIDTLKAKKSGTDLFPEFAGVGTISATVDSVLDAHFKNRSGSKNNKNYKTKTLPASVKVEVHHNVSAPIETNTESAVQVSQAPVKTLGTVSATEMGSMTFTKLKFNDYYKGIFGEPATNFDMCIDGAPGTGKTVFLLKFANYLADYQGPTLFVTTEEFGSSTLIDKIQRFDIKSKNLSFAKAVPALDELKKYKFIFIDSINHARITIEQYQQIREKAPNTSFILVLQQTKSGSYKGSTDWPHEVEITMSLFKNEFDERMLKISKDRYTDPIPRIVKI